MTILNILQQKVRLYEGYYAVLVERAKVRDDALACRFLEIVDRELIRQNCMYAGKRNDSYIGPPQLVRLPSGTWSDYIARETRRNGTDESQYKHPALVPQTAWLERFRPADTVTVHGVKPAGRGDSATDEINDSCTAVRIDRNRSAAMEPRRAAPPA